MHLSFNEKAHIYFNNPYAGVGLLFSLIGTVLFTSSLLNSDLLSIQFYLNTTALTTGYITNKEETNNTENEQPVYAFNYSYRVSGKTYEGRSFSSTIHLQTGDKAQIEYITTKTIQSRIKGTNNAPFPIWVALFNGSFAASGIWLVSKNIRRTNRVLDIIANAYPTTGIKEEVRATSMEISDKTLYELVYSYTYNGQKYTHTFQTLHPSKFQVTETLFLNRFIPSHAVLAIALPALINESLTWLYKTDM